MDQKSTQSERGQSIVIVALMMIALVGILALAIDGGFAYAKRRSAQNAADAAALAGASLLCTDNAAQADDVAYEYAITRNEAFTWTLDIDDNLITVSTFFPYQNFLAGLFGQPNSQASATAVAGCFTPCSGVGVLPVAWACQPPAGEPGNDECAIEYGTVDTPGPTYVIMDSKDLNEDFYCQDPPNSGTPAGALDCDLNDDDYNDLWSSGNRSWLDLNGGGGGASELAEWIENGFPGEISVHTWLGGSPGVENSVFQAVNDRVNDFVILPVFDQFCEDYPPSQCPASMQITDTVVTSGAGSNYFHITSFSVFKITCVNAPPNMNPVCPGKAAALAANPSLPNNLKTIEGYFVEGYVPGLRGACDLDDAQAFTVYLRR